MSLVVFEFDPGKEYEENIFYPWGPSIDNLNHRKISKNCIRKWIPSILSYFYLFSFSKVNR